MTKKIAVRRIFILLAAACFLGGGVALVFADGMPLSNGGAALTEASVSNFHEQKVGSEQETAASAAEENSLGLAASSSAAEENFSLRDGGDNLRLFSFEAESLAVESLGGEDGGKISVFSDGERFVRKFFDGQMRLVRTETWRLGDSPAVVSEEIFSYDGKSGRLASTVTRNSDSEREAFYDADGRIVRAMVFRTKPENGNSVGRILERSEIWEYQPDGKLSSFGFEKMDESGNKVAFSRREVFSHKKGAAERQPPDAEIYEDGALRERRLYSGEEDYEATIFFGGGLEVTTKYAGGVKVAEAFSQNGAVVLGKAYGQD